MSAVIVRPYISCGHHQNSHVPLYDDFSWISLMLIMNLQEKCIVGPTVMMTGA